MSATYCNRLVMDMKKENLSRVGGGNENFGKLS
jgi:hypothetical protein